MIRFEITDVKQLQQLAIIVHELIDDIKRKSEIKQQASLQIQQTFPRLSKTIIDKLDTSLAKHYGFIDEELDFIINYDIKYRMGWRSVRHNRQKP